MLIPVLTAIKCRACDGAPVVAVAIAVGGAVTLVVAHHLGGAGRPHIIRGLVRILGALDGGRGEHFEALAIVAVCVCGDEIRASIETSSAEIEPTGEHAGSGEEDEVPEADEGE